MFAFSNEMVSGADIVKSITSRSEIQHLSGVASRSTNKRLRRVGSSVETNIAKPAVTPPVST